jgi:hypothetical protein
MFDTIVLERSPLDERRLIWQRFKAGELDVEIATARLLRIDIDGIARARELRDNKGEPVRT